MIFSKWGGRYRQNIIGVGTIDKYLVHAPILNLHKFITLPLRSNMTDIEKWDGIASDKEMVFMLDRRVLTDK